MEREDFERLYEQHASALYGFLVYRTSDAALAEDLLADTFERALRARKRFDRRKASEKTWLYTIALNLLRDSARRRGSELRALERMPHEEAEPPDRLAAIEDRDQLSRAMHILSDEEREAVALRFGGDLTVPEIAKLLGQPLPRVEGRVYRSLRKLRDELG
ncbi:MAG TPA: RNA polymerase sigma factor [Thermoleophilaceae bacterium]|nr:RNA polymerase sigma factor [Thermoleophilaceae bacterium]